jgi:hypothetical protein
VEPARQTAWSNNPNRVLSPDLYAALVAQGAVELELGAELAKREGYAGDKFRSLVYMAQRAPSHAEALEMRRRNEISDAQLRHTFGKEQIEQQYWDALAELVEDRLSPQVVALAVVRGLMQDPGLLPVGPPSTVGNVPAFPVSTLDTLDESASGGFGRERLQVLAGIMGRPMGPESAAFAYFRDILKRADYDRAISEGDVRNEWADAILETQRAIPSVADYVNARIRGWITDDEMNAGTARHGMSAADTHLLYLRTGRPAAPGQMQTAAARGIDGPDGKPMDRTQFLKGIAESDIRPEWGPMLWGIRHAYPPLFQVNRLVQAGAIDTDTAITWLEYDRYAPEVLAALRKYFDGLAPAAVKHPYTAKAESQLWTATHRSYVVDTINDTTARESLAQLGLGESEIDSVLVLWDHEKGITVKPLTPSQIKKAYTTNQITIDDAIARLEAQGRDDADARLYLTQ